MRGQRTCPEQKADPQMDQTCVVLRPVGEHRPDHWKFNNTGDPGPQDSGPKDMAQTSDGNAHVLVRNTEGLRGVIEAFGAQ